MSPRVLAVAGLMLALSFTTTPAAAQLGGLAKKARQKAAETAGVPSVDQPARMAGPEVTPQVVDQMLTGLKAEATAQQQAAEAERQRQARDSASRAAAEQQGACPERARDKDPAWPEIQRLQRQGQEAADKGDYSKATEIAQKLTTLTTEMQARIQAACSRDAQAGQQTTAEQQAIADAGAPPEAQGAKAAGIPRTDYAQLKELIYTYFQSPKRAGLAPAEAQAIDAKKRELRERLKAVGLGT